MVLLFKNKNIFTGMNFRRAGLAIVVIIAVALFFLNRKDVTLVKQDSFELLPISVTGDVYKSVIHLHNPNLLSSTIKTIEERYSINGVELARFNMELNQGILGLKETTFPINVRFAKDDYYNAAHADSSMPSQINVLIEGEISFSNLTGGGTIKIYQTETIAVKDL